MPRSSRLPLMVISTCLLALMVAVAPRGRAPALASPEVENCWAGNWSSNWNDMHLVQEGAAVSGTYEYDQGRISGTADGLVLRGQWLESPSYTPPSDGGRFVFTANAACTEFTGTWGYGDSECCGGWHGTRLEDQALFAAKVIRPTVTYRGAEVAPGDTFFPHTCDPAMARGPASCNSLITLQLPPNQQISRAAAYYYCVTERITRVLLILQHVQLSDDDAELVLYLVLKQVAEGCAYDTARDVQHVEFVFEQGHALIANMAPGQVISVDAQTAVATSATPGSFLAGYDPTPGTATFRAYTSPLTIVPDSGEPLQLEPHSQVQVTADGAGPVTELLWAYLPTVIR